MSRISGIELSYLVCATPRSGSTLLCELLAQTGVAGHPREYFELLPETSLPRQAREFFANDPDADFVDLLPETDPGEPESPDDWQARLDAALREGTGPNGVFGAKVMWDHLLHLGVRLGEEHPPNVSRALAELLPRLRYVHVTRGDKTAQAVSLWKAVQTQEWRDGASGRRDVEPVYSFDAIGHLVRRLTEQERAWEVWLRDREEVVRVSYDELAAEPARTVGRVLTELGIDGDPAHAVEPPLQRQADETSEEWSERFTAEEREVAA